MGTNNLGCRYKTFSLKKQNQVRPQGAGKSALGLGTRSKQNYSLHIRDLWIQSSSKSLSWNLESGALESGIPLTIGIRNPSFTEKESGIQFLESGIHGVESRIQDCPGFPYTDESCNSLHFEPINVSRYFFIVSP